MQAFLFDSNVWVAVTFTGHEFHQSARAVLLEATPLRPVCISRAIEQSWLRLITTSFVQKSCDSPPVTNHTAIATLELWISNSRVKTVEEPEGTRALWLKLADLPTASPKRWMDAYLAAFAISGKFRFVTFDKDFRQFETAGLDLHLLTA